MARVVNTNSPGKRRNHATRTIAEMMRRLSQKAEMDHEAHDMAACIVLCLREIDGTVIESITAWEKRGYWQKADKFQLEWMWAGQLASQMEKMIREDDWQQMPEMMMKLFPHFSGIEIKNLTRKADTWEGSYDELLANPGT